MGLPIGATALTEQLFKTGITEIEIAAVATSPGNQAARVMLAALREHLRFVQSEAGTKSTQEGSYNFTERVWEILALARETAGVLRHEYVGTEHILLSIIIEGKGVACAILQNLNVDRYVFQTKIMDKVTKGHHPVLTGRYLPYTSRAKKVIALALNETRELEMSYTGSEHLLLGLLLERQSIAFEVLQSFGLNVEAVREELKRLLDPLPMRNVRGVEQ